MIYKVIGLMSGSSLDGLDIAYCEFEEKNNRWKLNKSLCETVTYTAEFIQKLSSCHRFTAEEYILFNNSYGIWIGEQVNEFIRINHLTPDLIASHGHTIFHQPSLKITHQIGAGVSIYAICKIPVVSDFRSLDVALGGEGAPLVPIGDEILFNAYDIRLNLGGIANLSYLNKDQLVAYDIAPFNQVLNHLSNIINLEYDKNGAHAAMGKLNDLLYKKLATISHFQTESPKSLGNEWVRAHILPVFKDYTVHESLNTYCIFTADLFASHLNSIAHKKGNTQKLLITGGGTWNDFFINQLKHRLKNVALEIPEPEIVNFKEAIIFALLGLLRFHNKTNIYESVTHGFDHSGGTLHNNFIRTTT